LTNVLNPRAFAAATEKIVEEARGDRLPFTFAYVDLDDFKQINDRLGHTGGDQALALVAEALQRKLRATDVIGRLGGDEFGLAFPQTGSAAAKRVMEDLVARVQSGVTEMPIEVTFSVGAVTFLLPPRTIDAVIKAADELMYQAKHDGKNRYRHRTVGEGDERAAPDHTPARGPTPRPREAAE
jgi:diguanylate cyclase (GGDEF)-like protein